MTLLARRRVESTRLFAYIKKECEDTTSDIKGIHCFLDCSCPLNSLQLMLNQDAKQILPHPNYHKPGQSGMNRCRYVVIWHGSARCQLTVTAKYLCSTFIANSLSLKWNLHSFFTPSYTTYYPIEFVPNPPFPA